MDIYERQERAGDSLEMLLAKFLEVNRTASSLDPNQSLRPIFMKVSAYCRWRGVGETKCWQEIRDGKLEIVRDGRNVLVTYRSALRRALELAVQTLEPSERRESMQRALEKGAAGIETAA
jgi:hypothetical protein